MNTHTPHTAMPAAAAALPANPHYEQVGGQDGVAQLVDAFYRHMDTLPSALGVRAMHEPDLRHTKDILKLFLCEWLGGPKDYSAQRGHPRLRQRHMPFAIGQAERDAWLQCMSMALDEVVPDPELRRQLMGAFFKTADFLRNQTPPGQHPQAPGTPSLHQPRNAP
jgi:hemoglobin